MGYVLRRCSGDRHRYLEADVGGPDRTEKRNAHLGRGWTMKRLLWLFFLLASPAWSATYYVSGSNTGAACNANMDLTTSRNTIAAGLACATSPGDTVIVKAGTYFERVRPPTSGFTITGVRGGAGEYLTKIEGSDLLTGFVAATDTVQGVDFTGTGVYSVTKPTWTGPVSGLTNDACVLTADGASIPHISWYWGDGLGTIPTALMPAAQALAQPASNGAGFWNGTEALFATIGTKLYIRFRNGDNPTTKTIRVAPHGARLLAGPKTEQCETSQYLQNPDFADF